MDWLYDGCRALAERGILPESFGYDFMVNGTIAALLASPLLGGLSHLVVTKRLAFFSSTLGNAALTGLTIGIVLGEPISQPIGGVFGFCLLMGLAMVYVMRRTRISPDTLVGVFLALTLGLGICLLTAVTQRFDIHRIEAIMFGNILTVTQTDLVILLVVAVGVAGVLVVTYNRILFAAVDPALARAAGVNVVFLEYLFVALLTLAIVASLKIIGALLVGALVVVPAAAAKNLAGSIRGYAGWSVAIATFGSLAGLMISNTFPVPSGGAIVLALAGLFFVTMGIGWVRRKAA